MMNRTHHLAVARSVRNHVNDPKIVRSHYQFGQVTDWRRGFRLFLDDARNPPIDEKGWVVVRNVANARRLMCGFGDLITECSLDNDLNSDEEGWQFLEWIIANENCRKNLRKITIHTGNDVKRRLMTRMIRGFNVKKNIVIPNDKIYPFTNQDERIVVPYCEK